MDGNTVENTINVSQVCDGPLNSVTLDNIDGVLRCGFNAGSAGNQTATFNPDLPQGPWLQPQGCTPYYYSVEQIPNDEWVGVIRTACPNQAGRMIISGGVNQSFVYGQLCPNAFLQNANGLVNCLNGPQAPANGVPPGSWVTQCQLVSWGGTTLTAMCPSFMWVDNTPTYSGSSKVSLNYSTCATGSTVSAQTYATPPVLLCDKPAQ
jgi:hypothetical protein